MPERKWYEDPSSWDRLEQEWAEQGLSPKTGYTSFTEYARAYEQEHGGLPGEVATQRESLAQAMSNAQWGANWARQTGAAPTQEQWKSHYYRPEEMGDTGQFWPTATQVAGAAEAPPEPRYGVGSIWEQAAATQPGTTGGIAAAVPLGVNEPWTEGLTGLSPLASERYKLARTAQQARALTGTHAPVTLEQAQQMMGQPPGVSPPVPPASDWETRIRSEAGGPYEFRRALGDVVTQPSMPGPPALVPTVGPQEPQAATALTRRDVTRGMTPQDAAALERRWWQEAQQSAATMAPILGMPTGWGTETPPGLPSLAEVQRQNQQAGAFLGGVLGGTVRGMGKTLEMFIAPPWQRWATNKGMEAQQAVTGAIFDALGRTVPSWMPQTIGDVQKAVQTVLWQPSLTTEQAIGAAILLGSSDLQRQSAARVEFLREQVVRQQAAGLADTPEYDAARMQYEQAMQGYQAGSEALLARRRRGEQGPVTLDELGQRLDTEGAAAWEAGRAGTYSGFPHIALAFSRIRAGEDPETVVQEVAQYQNVAVEMIGQSILDPLNVIPSPVEWLTNRARGVHYMAPWTKPVGSAFGVEQAAEGIRLANDKANLIERIIPGYTIEARQASLAGTTNQGMRVAMEGAETTSDALANVTRYALDTDNFLLETGWPRSRKMLEGAAVLRALPGSGENSWRNVTRAVMQEATEKGLEGTALHDLVVERTMEHIGKVLDDFVPASSATYVERAANKVLGNRLYRGMTNRVTDAFIGLNPPQGVRNLLNNGAMQTVDGFSPFRGPGYVREIEERFGMTAPEARAGIGSGGAGEGRRGRLLYGLNSAAERRTGASIWAQSTDHTYAELWPRRLSRKLQDLGYDRATTPAQFEATVRLLAETYKPSQMAEAIASLEAGAARAGLPPAVRQAAVEIGAEPVLAKVEAATTPQQANRILDGAEVSIQHWTDNDPLKGLTPLDSPEGRARVAAGETLAVEDAQINAIAAESMLAGDKTEARAAVIRDRILEADELILNAKREARTNLSATEWMARNAEKNQRLGQTLSELAQAREMGVTGDELYRGLWKPYWDDVEAIWRRPAGEAGAVAELAPRPRPVTPTGAAAVPEHVPPVAEAVPAGVTEAERQVADLVQATQEARRLPPTLVNQLWDVKTNQAKRVRNRHGDLVPWPQARVDKLATEYGYADGEAFMNAVRQEANMMRETKPLRIDAQQMRRLRRQMAAEDRIRARERYELRHAGQPTLTRAETSAAEVPPQIAGAETAEARRLPTGLIGYDGPGAVYHVTTRAEQVLRDGVLRPSTRGGGGLGGWKEVAAVSFTTNRQTAELIQRELQRAATVARQPQRFAELLPVWAKEDARLSGLADNALDQLAADVVDNYALRSGPRLRETPPESARLAFQDYLMKRPDLGGPPDPVLHGSTETLLAIDPNNVRIIGVSREGLALQAGTDDFLQEVLSREPVALNVPPAAEAAPQVARAETTAPVGQARLGLGRATALPEWADELASVGSKIDDDGTILLYHATTRNQGERILREGVLRRPADAPDAYGVYLSTSRDVASSYGDGTVIPVRVRIQDITPDDVFPGQRMDFMASTYQGNYRPVAVGDAALAPPAVAPPGLGQQARDLLGSERGELRLGGRDLPGEPYARQQWRWTPETQEQAPERIREALDSLRANHIKVEDVPHPLNSNDMGWLAPNGSFVESIGYHRNAALLAPYTRHTYAGQAVDGMLADGWIRLKRGEGVEIGRLNDETLGQLDNLLASHFQSYNKGVNIDIGGPYYKAVTVDIEKADYLSPNFDLRTRLEQAVRGGPPDFLRNQSGELRLGAPGDDTFPTRARIAEQMRAVLRQMREAITVQPGRIEPLSPEALAILRGDGFKQLRQAMQETRLFSVRTGAVARDFSLHNYPQKTAADLLASIPLMYPFWATRTYPKMFLRALMHPNYLATYLRYKRALHEANADLPPWYRDQLRIHVPWLPEPYLFNVEAMLNPMYQLQQTFERPGQRDTTLGEIGYQMDRFGFSPHWWMTTADAISRAVSGDTEGAKAAMGYLSPQTRALKYATGVLGMNEGRGITVEPWNWWGGPSQPFSGGDSYERRRVASYISQKVLDGTWTPAQGREAAIRLAHGQVDDALVKEAMGTEIQRRGVPTLIASLLGPGLKSRPQSEVQLEADWKELNAIYGSDMSDDQFYEALGDFYSRKPYMSYVNMGRADLDEADRLYFQDVTRSLPPGQKLNILESYDSDGQGMPIVQKLWDQFAVADNSAERTAIMANLSDDERRTLYMLLANVSPKYPPTGSELAGEWREVRRRYGTLEDVTRQQWPGMLEAKDELYALAPDLRAAWRDTHPGYEQYEDWSEAQIKADPLLQWYYGAPPRKQATGAIWDLWWALPSNLDKSRLVNFLGPEFETLFLNKETRDYSKLTNDQLFSWTAQLVNAGSQLEPPVSMGLQRTAEAEVPGQQVGAPGEPPAYDLAITSPEQMGKPEKPSEVVATTGGGGVGIGPPLVGGAGTEPGLGGPVPGGAAVVGGPGFASSVAPTGAEPLSGGVGVGVAPEGQFQLASPAERQTYNEWKSLGAACNGGNKAACSAMDDTRFDSFRGPSGRAWKVYFDQVAPGWRTDEAGFYDDPTIAAWMNPDTRSTVTPQEFINRVNTMKERMPLLRFGDPKEYAQAREEQDAWQEANRNLMPRTMAYRQAQLEFATAHPVWAKYYLRPETLASLQGYQEANWEYAPRKEYGGRGGNTGGGYYYRGTPFKPAPYRGRYGIGELPGIERNRMWTTAARSWPSNTGPGVRSY